MVLLAYFKIEARSECGAILRTSGHRFMTLRANGYDFSAFLAAGAEMRHPADKPALMGSAESARRVIGNRPGAH
jgi:hypothetical protein